MKVIEIDNKWLIEVAPHYFKAKDIQDENRKMPKGKGASRDETRFDNQFWQSSNLYNYYCSVHIYMYIKLIGFVPNLLALTASVSR